MIEVAAQSITPRPKKDSDEPEKFDGLRFYKMRQQQIASKDGRQESGSKRQPILSASLVTVLLLDMGDTPARVVSSLANEIKMILAHMILAYDMHLEEGETQRYLNMRFANFVSEIINPFACIIGHGYANVVLIQCFPDPTKTISLKRVAD